MVSLTRSKAVLDLGSRLVEQLDAPNDLVASWMAHYLAELMDAVASGPEEEKPAAQERCTDAILKLWEYRAALPPHVRPMAELEPILRTLASLDVDSTDHRYHRYALRAAVAAIDHQEEDVKECLELALHVDRAARFLIRTALRVAAERAATAAEPWVDLAAKAGAKDGAERFLVRFSLQDDDPAEERGALLKEQISQLESLMELASGLAEDLRAELPADEGQSE